MIDGELESAEKFDQPLVVRRLRELLGIKQEALASMLGVSQAYVSRLESGRMAPNEMVASRLQHLEERAQRDDPLFRLESSVELSPGMESIVFLRRKRICLKKFSQGFRAAGSVFCDVEDGEVLEGRVGDSADEHFDILKYSDAFSADVRYVVNVWQAEALGRPIFMRAVSVPIIDRLGNVFIKSTHSEISEIDFEKSKKFCIMKF